MNHRRAVSEPVSSYRQERPKPYYRFGFVIFMVISIALSGFYLRFAWVRYQEMFASEAIKLAESLEALLPAQDITNLSAVQGDRGAPEFRHVKNKLMRLVETNSLIYYAYLVGEQDGEVFVLVDSNTSDTSSYSPLENIKQELLVNNWIPFQARQSVLSKPVQNQWGSWIRALVPVKDSESGEIIAVLGLSYSAKTWNQNVWKRMLPDVLVALSLLSIFASFLWIAEEHGILKEKSRSLAFGEELYRSLFEQASIGITLNAFEKNEALPYQTKSINPMANRILGRDIQDMAEVSWKDITYPEDLDAEMMQFEQFVHGESDGYTIEKRIIKPDGAIVWVKVQLSSFVSNTSENFTYLCLIEDVSARKAMEKTLRESERSKSVLLSHLPGMAYRTRNDCARTMEFVSEGCKVLTGYAPESLLHNRDISYNDMISPEYRELLWEKHIRAGRRGKSFRYEYEIVTKTGERKWVLELGQSIYGQDGGVEAIEGIVLDITEQKKSEAQILYLYERDFLTGLYNRTYLEQEKRQLSAQKHLPLSVAICDINGLRMINDAYGHVQGDRLIVEVAKLIQGCCLPGDILGRISGGEFMLLMPCTADHAAQERMVEIQTTIESYSRTKQQPLYEISLSIGHSTMESEDQHIEDVVKTAESYLKHRKLLNQKSFHYSILSSIMATLYAKSQETEEHGQRLGQYAAMVGERLHLDQKELDDLRLLSMLHDIGKIGVDDRILNKPGKLTAAEWEQMEKHPEIGYRIAMSTPELMHIAEGILHHHERWDGAGYPAGKKGEEIPLLSRILAVADAYDAMMEDRVYRRALSPDAAIAEIKRGAATQFDPVVAALFIEIIENELHYVGGKPDLPDTAHE